MNSHARLSLPALALALAMIGPVTAGFAQTGSPTAEPDPHHPQGSQSVTPAPAPTPGTPTSTSGPSGTMGGRDQMMTMMRGMTGERGGMMFDHVEGRLAFLKTELKITDAQMPQWNRFADTLRSTATAMNGTHQQMMQGGMPTTLLARLDLHEKMLSAHLEALKGMRAALDPLYASLSDEQKKQADELIMSPMGMM